MATSKNFSVVNILYMSGIEATTTEFRSDTISD